MLRIISVSTLVVCFFCSCALYRTNVEYSELNLHTSAEPADHPRTLRLRGLIVSSILVPKRFESHTEGRTLLITLVGTVARRGDVNGFDATFDIPDSISEVRFGSKRELIWSRGKKHRSNR